MKLARIRTLVRSLAMFFVAPLLLAGCDTTTGPEETPAREVGVVVNSSDRSITVFRVDDPSVRSTIGVGPDGTPGRLALRGEIAVVPLGTVPAAAVIDLRAGALLRTVPLPQGSGAAGAAFLNDSIVLVANSNLGTVSPINVRSGARGADLPVGRYPQVLVSVSDTVYVVNAELGADFQPAGPSTLTVIVGSPPRVLHTITLRGTNAGDAAVAPGGRLFVIHSGRFGEPEGSLSVVDRGTLTETAHHTGFGTGPGSIAVDAEGRAYVGAFGVGMLVWDSSSGSFTRGPTNAVVPGGVASTSGVGIDSAGRLYALEPECQNASVVFRLSSAFGIEQEIPVGTCPLAIAFTRIPADD
jgi:hypothetical protein